MSFTDKKPNDPRITLYYGGGGMCPEQHEGLVHTEDEGTYFFYFRYRGGYASVTLMDPEDPIHYLWFEALGYGSMDYGDSLQGSFFGDQDARNEVFTKCLDKAFASLNDPEFRARQAEMQEEFKK